ncbi:LacI family DNA-binding transcriptional regulator [Glutamicibacter sp. NPDC087344]|uniref:LacI family DNA-binding transcriptional regulator n=1 Tax=Glutamicibacter sp. NPDC087344 TaxID=3363994 RepID=UPI003819A460
MNIAQPNDGSPAHRPPSMADVAAVAGVSHQTVSRVLNDHPNVRPGTRERVLEAIEQLSYRRNRAARTLATSHSSTVGILTVGSEFFGPQSTVLAVESAARSRGYFVTVTALDRYDVRTSMAALNHLIDQGVDGVVVVAPFEKITDAIDAADLKVPVVVVAARTQVPEGDPARYVYVDQREGASQATRHLLALGHRKIAHVSGPTGWFDALERKIGWQDQMAAAKAPAIEVPAESWLSPSGYETGLRLVEQVRSGEVSAVFAANDYLAIGVLRAFWEAGLKVPQDVSVVGFDDLQVSNYLIPALTTVRQPFADVGHAALNVLLSPAADLLLPRVTAPTLVIRASTAPPPAH